MNVGCPACIIAGNHIATFERKNTSRTHTRICYLVDDVFICIAFFHHFRVCTFYLIALRFVVFVDRRLFIFRGVFLHMMYICILCFSHSATFLPSFFHCTVHMDVFVCNFTLIFHAYRMYVQYSS